MAGLHPRVMIEGAMGVEKLDRAEFATQVEDQVEAMVNIFRRIREGITQDEDPPQDGW